MDSLDRIKRLPRWDELIKHSECWVSLKRIIKSQRIYWTPNRMKKNKAGSKKELQQMQTTDN